MRKAITTSIIVVVAVMMAAAPTAAGRMWCRADPIVSFNGTNIQVWVEMPSEYQYLVNGPIRFQITTPEGVATAVHFSDAGFNGYGEDIRFVTNRDQSKGTVGLQTHSVTFSVSVPLDAKRLANDFGTPASSVQIRLRVIDADGFERVVGGSATGAKLSVIVHSN